jgi:glycine oxidase
LNPDFIVIGAGVVGLSTALELLLRGASVSLIDKGPVGQESSWAGGGILSPLLPWNYPEAVNALTEAGRAAFPDLCRRLRADTGIDPEYRTTGMLVLPPVNWLRAHDWCSAHGWPWEERDCGFALAASNGNESTLAAPGGAGAQSASAAGPGAGTGTRQTTIEEHVEVQPGDAEWKIAALQTSHGPRSPARTSSPRVPGALTCLASKRSNPHISGARMLLYEAEPSLLSTIVAGRVSHPACRWPHPRRHTLEDVGFDKSVTVTPAKNCGCLRFGITAPTGTHARFTTGPGFAQLANIPIIGRHPTSKTCSSTPATSAGVTMAPSAAALLADLALGNRLIDPASLLLPEFLTSLRIRQSQNH